MVVRSRPKADPFATVVRVLFGRYVSGRKIEELRHELIRRPRRCLRGDGLAECNRRRTRVCWDSSRVYHGCGEMDHGGEALIGLVGAHCDTFELLEPGEEVLDEMPPFVHLLVDGEGLCATRMLGDDDLGAARVEFGDNSVAVERLVADQRIEGQSLNERWHSHRVEALSRQKHEAHEIAERISE